MINFSSNPFVNFCELSGLSLTTFIGELASECGSSSVVERLLAKEKVEGSNPFARSSCSGWLMADDNEPESRLRSAELLVATWPSWIRQGSAKP